MTERTAFVDAHVHLWDLDHIRYPWLCPPFAEDGPNGSVEPIAGTYRLDDYLVDARNWDVRGIVHVEAGAEPAAALAETGWVQRVADAAPFPIAIVAFAALDDPDVATLLADHAAHPGVRGIRHIVNWHQEPRRTYTPRDVTRDAAWGRGFAALADHGLSFDLQCYPAQMRGIADIAARHPSVPIIVNHMGMPVLDDPGGLDTWRTGMAALAALPQAAVKISGMGFVRRPWTADDIAPLIRETIALFGSDRAMFASDFPTDRLFGGYDETVGAYRAIVADLDDAARRDLFGGTAARIYRLDVGR